MEKGRARARKAAWILGSIATVALLVFAWNIGEWVSPPAAPAKPLHIASFADGGSLEVLGLSTGSRMIHLSDGQHHPSPLATFTSGASESKWIGLGATTEEKGGVPLSCRIVPDTPRALTLEFRLASPDGNNIVRGRYLDDWGFVSDDHHFRTSTPSINGSFEPRDDSPVSLRAEMKRTGLPFLLQHHDPDSGWIHLLGPVVFHEPWPDRYVSILNSWDRSRPTLDFKAIRLDGGTVEFSLPNPDHRAKPETLSPTPLPFVHSGSDFTLEVQSIKRLARPGNHPLSALDIDLTYTGPRSHGLPDIPIHLDNASQVDTDDWGNSAAFRTTVVAGKTYQGVFLPAASERMKLKLVVSRDRNYPRTPTDAFLLLDGTVTADGRGIDFEPGADAPLFGISKMPVCRVEPADTKWHGKKLESWKTLKFRVEGASGRKEMEHIQSKVGDLTSAIFVFFPAGLPTSVGMGDIGGIGNSSSGPSGFEFGLEATNTVPPDLLEPGDTFRIGVVGKLPTETVDVDLELPAEIQKP